LIEQGKIKAVGRGLRAQSAIAASTLVLDGRGKHVTPGIIDAHNHSIALGAVNEATLPSSAMVRIGDVVNSESVNVHKQLAGGLTTLNLLHGSANPIGGQNAILKLRDGASPEGMKFAGAPPGIKFALGENVKQSNWGDRKTNRFPQTRMGVQTFFANRFTAAQQYLKEWDDYRNAGPSSGLLPPRRNLELEAIGEILQGKRWIHCHSYRQDEILAFLRTMEGFGVKVGTLQHILEGYKVADEIARHGAGASSFADWWAYKFEVYDAIPYNGSLMRERGVVVSFNSDSSDLSRRLYLEAAKAVKYGGTPEEEALKFVTLNPAKQLRIDPWVGSLEPGKDGDFVLWSKAPLDSTTVCLQTWIEGKQYFDRDRETALSRALEKERAELLEKAKRVLKAGGPAEGGTKETDKFFELPLEHRYDNQDRHCLEEE
jgi:N-acetylglucosamine-6-phosphate deacetylase